MIQELLESKDEEIKWLTHELTRFQQGTDEYRACFELLQEKTKAFNDFLDSV